MRFTHALSLSLAAAALFAGAAGAVEPAASPKAAALYVGYYQEDPNNNPEDPTIGAVYLNLPNGGGNFSGDMFFTYVGCQTSNVGTITGTLTGDHLQGSWTGTTDGTAQHGNFSGERIKALDGYSGTYSVAGGKQHISVADCIEYYIAAKGTFELFAVGNSEPPNFSLMLNGKVVAWPVSLTAALTLVAVLDPEVARANHGNATLWQTLMMGGQHSAALTDVHLVKGHTYVTTVSVVDRSFKRVSFASTQFVAP